MKREKAVQARSAVFQKRMDVHGSAPYIQEHDHFAHETSPKPA